MLRNRSRAVTTKQALMADQNSVSSLSQKQTKPISNFFGSPRFFNGFLSKGPSETETISPTSVLDTKSFSIIRNPPIGYDKPTKIFSGNKQPWENGDPKGIGLALIDSINDENTDKILSKPHSRMVLFGSKLKIQIPPIPTPTFSPTQSPNSPSDFGIKTRNSQFTGSLSPFGSPNSGIQTKNSPRALSEMELSEDYTCVISHGPNPKTIHIYDNCIVENYCGGGGGGGGVGFSKLKKENSSPEKSPESFLSFCYTCKKNLEQGKDIYMYRGEKPFCSSECRYQEMLFDGEEIPGI